MNLSSVIGISTARLILVIRGQWLADESWQYNPLLAVEVSEISFTAISLSIPGCKPLWDRLVSSSSPHGHVRSVFCACYERETRNVGGG